MSDASTTVQQVSAEVLGTFVLVFFGCGTALMSGGDYVATALAFGLTVLVMAYAVGRVSGAHFNPAVTSAPRSAAGSRGGRSPSTSGPSSSARSPPALFLFILMHGFEGFDATGNMGQNSFGDAGSGYAWWAAFLLELLMTAVFVWVILAVTDVRNEHPALAPLAIGLALTMIHFGSIAATGTSVNPARSIGVGVFAGADAIVQLWLFILAPLLGGAIAGISLPAAVRPRSRGRAWLRPEARPRPDLLRARWVRAWLRPGVGCGARGTAHPTSSQEQWYPETADGDRRGSARRS